MHQQPSPDHILHETDSLAGAWQPAVVHRAAWTPPFTATPAAAGAAAAAAVVATAATAAAVVAAAAATAAAVVAAATAAVVGAAPAPPPAATAAAAGAFEILWDSSNPFSLHPSFVLTRWD